MAAIPSYRAEMIGLSERDRTLLRSLLAASQARTGIRWDGGAAQPVVHFVDVEGQAGADFWQSLSDADRRDGAIAIAGAAPAGATHWLPKPLRSASLLGVLERMSLTARATAAPVAAAGVPASAASTVRTVVRAPKPGEPLGLLDVLDDAPGTTARTVQSAHWPDLVLGSGNTHAMRTAAIDQYADGFAASLEVARVAKYTGGPMDDELRIDVDTLRWLAFLYAPGTEIAERLPLIRRARLRKPPAFAHLPHKSHHVRMAASLAQHAATPQELAESTGADLESVQRFLGACAAIGLLEEVAEPAAVPIAMPAPAAAPTAAMSTPAAAPTRRSVPFTSPVAPSRDGVNAPVAAAPVSEPAAPAAVVAEDVEAAAAAAAAANGDLAAEPSGETPASDGGSVLERLRAAREQNRARVAAAIRSISNH